MIDTYVYFVSYAWYSKDRRGFGNIQIRSDGKFKSLDELKTTQKIILDGMNSEDDAEVCILNFQLLDSYNKEERGKDV